MTANRPRARSTIEIVHRNAARLAFVLTTVLALAAVVVAARVLPERVPTHFGASGAADDWSSRTAAIAFLGASTAGLASMFAALVRWTPRMSVEWMNVPNKQQWIEAGLEDELRRRLRADLLVFGTGMNVVSLSVTLSMVQAARSDSGGLPLWWFLLFGAWLLFTIGHVVFMYAVRYRLAPAGR
jgi:hypothetical protein